MIGGNGLEDLGAIEVCKGLKGMKRLDTLNISKRYRKR